MGFMTWIIQAQALVSKVTVRTGTLVASSCTAAWRPLRAGVGITQIQLRLKYSQYTVFSAYELEIKIVARKKERHVSFIMCARKNEHANIQWHHLRQLHFEYQAFKNHKGWNTLHDFCLDLQCRWVSASCQKYTTRFWTDSRPILLQIHSV